MKRKMRADMEATLRKQLEADLRQTLHPQPKKETRRSISDVKFEMLSPMDRDSMLGSPFDQGTEGEEDAPAAKDEAQEDQGEEAAVEGGGALATSLPLGAVDASSKTPITLGCTRIRPRPSMACSPLGPPPS